MKFLSQAEEGENGKQQMANVFRGKQLLENIRMTSRRESHLITANGNTIQRCFDSTGGTWICQLSSQPQKTARQRPQIIGKEDHKGNL